MIYDCFTFFNELDLLEIRLNTLDGVVDKFVLVEATFTHQGNPKELFYESNKERYKAFWDKIIHIVVKDIPENYFLAEDKSWILENYQRNCIAWGLDQAKPDDQILISDVDEIPYPEILKKLKSKQEIVFFGLKHYAYYLNTVIVKKGTFFYLLKLRILSYFSFNYKRKLFRATNLLGPFMVPFHKLDTPQYWRNQRENLKKEYLLLPLSGWHFSYLGGVDKILEKLSSINIEFDYTPYADNEKIEKLLSKNRDIFDKNRSLVPEPIDQSFPLYIVQNQEKFKELILKKSI